ncbi:ribosome recycling factor [Candidatus Falkowbacteria bacterium]|nr:ribosome recycling factor [Candidatus Falkowbacteria bacterium]
MNQFIQEKQEDFDKAIEFFKKDIANLRTGRANPAILEKVHVPAYGVMNPVNAVGNIAVADAKSMTVTPWDKNIIKDLEKAIVDADLGVGVVNEGDKIRLNIPQMTEENRKDLVKKLNEKMEQTRINLRQVRDEIKEAIEKAEKDKEITEDEKYDFIEELDEEIKKLNENVKDIRDKKEEDIMTV